MQVTEQVQMDRVLGEWMFCIDASCSTCGDAAEQWLRAKDFIEWIRRYAPELLKEPE